MIDEQNIEAKLIVPKDVEKITQGEYSFIRFKGFADDPDKTYKTDYYELAPGDITIMATGKPVLNCIKVLNEEQIEELNLRQSLDEIIRERNEKRKAETEYAERRKAEMETNINKYWNLQIEKAKKRQDEVAEDTEKGDWTSAKIHALSELRNSNLYPLDNFSDQTIYAGSFLSCIKKVDHPIQRKKCIEKNRKTYRELSKFILELDNFISEELENVDYDYKFRCSCLAILNDHKSLFESWFKTYGVEIPDQQTVPAVDLDTENDISLPFGGIEEKMEHIINKKFCRKKLTMDDIQFIEEHKSAYKKVRKRLLKPYENKYEDIYKKVRIPQRISKSELLRYFDKELEDNKPELAKIITDNFVKWIKAKTKFQVSINLDAKGKKIIILDYK